MNEPRDPGSDAKLKVGELDGITQMLLKQFQEFRNEMKEEVGVLRTEIRETRKAVDDRTAPGKFNWLGAISVTVAVLVAFGAFLTFLFNSKIDPIRTEVEGIKQKLTGDVQAMEIRINEKINLSIREIDTFKRDTTRESVWQYADSKSRAEFLGKQIDYLFRSVFLKEAPQFQSSPKP